MSVRMRHTSSHTKNRRSHHALSDATIVADKESGALRLPHRLDETTGMYRGKQIIPKKEMKAKVDHDKKVAKSKLEHAHDHAEGGKEPMHSVKEDVPAGKVGRQGLIGRMTLGKAKTRSGFGGGV